MKMKLLYTLALAMLLSACGQSVTRPDGQALTIHQRYSIACVSTAAGYDVIIAANKLKPLPKATQDRILSIKRNVFDKRCKLGPGEDYPHTASEAVMAEIEGAAGTIATIRGELQ